mmetsp:Transcript_24575/g.54736  ORF Transcript_24575/g.54736 Transcript_24575/m.54736 type:complete len:279 (-) Transcript_24575:17-853(-)
MGGCETRPPVPESIRRGVPPALELAFAFLEKSSLARRGCADLARADSEWAKAVQSEVERALFDWHPEGNVPLQGTAGSIAQLLESAVRGGRWKRVRVTDIMACADKTKLSQFIEGVVQTGDKARLLFHGTVPSNHDEILESNLFTGETWSEWLTQSSWQRYGGWFGCGAYLTSNPVYAQHYVNMRGGKRDSHFCLPQSGQSIKVLGVWARPGRTFWVTDMSNQGKGCEPGYDSHHVFVKFRGKDFFATSYPKAAEADEWVLFRREQMLPMFVISLEFV